MSDFADLQAAFVLTFTNPLLWLVFFMLLFTLFVGVHIGFYAAFRYFSLRGRR